MKITIYELLGMVKDGKAPKEIKYDGMIWEYDGDYYSTRNNLILEEYTNLSTSLNDKVEILEEEKKIPEKLSTWFSVAVTQKDEDNVEYANLNFGNMYAKINEICDYLKSKGEQ